MPSNSVSQSETKTEQRDERVAASDQAIAIGAGASVSIDATDPAAFELTGDLLEAFETVGGEAITRTFNFASQAQDMIADSLQKREELLLERERGADASLAQTALRFALPVAVAGVVVYGIARGK